MSCEAITHTMFCVFNPEATMGMRTCSMPKYVTILCKLSDMSVHCRRAMVCIARPLLQVSGADNGP